MSFPSIRIEGAILSPDILEQVEELPGQKPAAFAMDAGDKVKDEIARAWADAQDYWRIFRRKLETVKSGSAATSETRNNWMVPLLGLLGYDLEYQARGTEIDGRIYAISHRAKNRANTSIHIIGARDPAGLDKKPANASRRMSAHALLQEFLNLHEQLYGVVTNGLVLRLLRDSSRLVKQSYLEFDLDRIFSDRLYADSAVMFRLLHATRLPLTDEASPESWIERYHQDSLDSGARIREGLSKAVEEAILQFGNGFLAHPENENLRELVAVGTVSEAEYFQQLLRLIYRLLFLIVIEERDLVFPQNAKRANRDIYQRYYSVGRLRSLSENRHLADARQHDLWLSLQTTFRLFEAPGQGVKLGIQPLAGDLFSTEAMQAFNGCTLGNDVLLKCLRSISLYRHPDSNQIIRVNYAALNVEEFGSVYEGLLEYNPSLVEGSDGRWTFAFVHGDDRATSGSHYTPDDLIQPLIRHSLDHLIEDCLAAKNPEKALLDLRVADIACGSGHALLSAARRIATALAAARTEEEQPAPGAYRAALRDVIRGSIYGVDVNPLAVELCKVALWLEAHMPGQPLGFLDHHIKCGNAIVGFARYEDLQDGIPTEAFKTLREDDKTVAAAYRRQNKEDLNASTQSSLDFSPKVVGRLSTVAKDWRKLARLPERTHAQVQAKKDRLSAIARGKHSEFLRTVAGIPVAQFYIPKLAEHAPALVTDAQFRSYWSGGQAPEDATTKAAREWNIRERIFHWFVEFPDVMERGGFDCILGNPPYLGKSALSGTFGHRWCELVKWRYAPAGLSDLVVFFLRRTHELLREGGFAAIITTNSIVDGDLRRDGLEQVILAGGEVNLAVRAIRWPGTANLIVSLLGFHNGSWSGLKILDGEPVSCINSFFEAGKETETPEALVENRRRMFQGTKFHGDGFLLSHDEADRLRTSDPTSARVIMPIINGKEINSEPDQAPGRSIINFFDWPLERAKEYPEPFSIVERKVKPYRATRKRKRNREFWWIYGEHRPGLIRSIKNLSHCFVTVCHTKHLAFLAMPTNNVFSHALYVFATDRWDLFAVVQSTLHEVWARKYSGSIKQDLRYSPSKCFDSFAFPAGLWEKENSDLAQLGERYHAHRKSVMESLWIGLTKGYNLFHAKDLSVEVVGRASKKDGDEANSGLDALIELRRLHVELDLAVRQAYGWQDVDLGHDFHEVETLPEKDRVRYTISPQARREILSRLLSENLSRAQELEQQ